jgi:hypothetical protein
MEVENITKQYVVPMSSGVHMEFPQKNQQRKMIHSQPFYAIAEPTNLGQEKVIEEMSGADGVVTASQNAQVKALEESVAKTTKRKDELNRLIDETNSQITNAKSNFDTFDRYTTDCKKVLHGLTPGYTCKDNHKVKIATHDAEVKQRGEWYERLNQLTAYKIDLTNELNRIDKDLPILQEQLAKAREQAAVASMTPEQKADYEIKKTQAEAEAAAIKTKSESEALALATSTKAKSNTMLVIGLSIAVLAVGGILVLILKGRKKGIPAPIPAPVK